MNHHSKASFLISLFKVELIEYGSINLTPPRLCFLPLDNRSWSNVPTDGDLQSPIIDWLWKLFILLEAISQKFATHSEGIHISRGRIPPPESLNNVSRRWFPYLFWGSIACLCHCGRWAKWEWETLKLGKMCYSSTKCSMNRNRENL